MPCTRYERKQEHNEDATHDVCPFWKHPFYIVLYETHINKLLMIDVVAFFHSCSFYITNRSFWLFRAEKVSPDNHCRVVSILYSRSRRKGCCKSSMIIRTHQKKANLFSFRTTANFRRLQTFVAKSSKRAERPHIYSICIFPSVVI